MVRLVPREAKFFEMFASLSENLLQGARLLAETLETMENVEVRVRKLTELEHAGDELTHSLITRLSQSFVTPFDREDIHRLATSLDDVLDCIHAAGEKLTMYRISAAPPAAARLADILSRQTQELSSAIAMLQARQDEDALRRCQEINRLESEADGVAREAIAKLFEREKDPIHLIKVKELYEMLETATNKAEDAANAVEAIVLKSA